MNKIGNKRSQCSLTYSFCLFDELTHVETESDFTVSSSRESNVDEVLKTTEDSSYKSKSLHHDQALIRHDIPLNKITRSFPPSHRSINIFRMQSQSFQRSHSPNPKHSNDSIQNVEFIANLNGCHLSSEQCEKSLKDFDDVPINLDITSVSSFESILSHARYLKFTDNDVCSTIIPEHEKLEVIACLNQTNILQLRSVINVLEEKLSDSTIQHESPTMISRFHSSIINTVEALRFAACMDRFCTADTTPNPSTIDIIEIRTGFNVSCTTSSGYHENVDAYAFGFVGSLAVYEQGDISDIDLASEIISSLLRRDLVDAEYWYFHIPVVCPIDVSSSNLIDSCALILQVAKNDITGVKATAFGYVLFILSRKEIRVERYSLS